MAKRGDNIRKRKDGRWEGRYKKGRAADGSIIYGSVYGKTYKEVKEKMASIQQRRLLPIILERQIFKEICQLKLYETI